MMRLKDRSKFGGFNFKDGLALAGMVLFGLTARIAPAQTCVSPPAGLVSWFAAEGNANDSLSTNFGNLYHGATFAAGKVGQAFSFNGTGAHVRVHDAPNLHFTNAMTWEFWVNPTAFNGAIIDKWDALEGHNQFSYGISVGSDGRISVALYPASGSAYVQMLSLSAIPAGQWTHVAATYDGAAIKVYLNGVFNNSLAYTGGIFPGTDDLGIGGQVGGEPLGTANVPFSGLIDEVSAYNRALTAAEILAIYNAGASGKCALPPVIVSQPAGTTNIVGTTAGFTVGAIGSQPLSYQWKLNGTNISTTTNATATNATLTIPNVQLGMSGNSYSVMITNNTGSTNSGNGMLTVIPPPPCQPSPPGLAAWFAAEGNANDSLTTNVGKLYNGATFAAGEVGQAFSLNGTGAHVRVHDAPNLHFTNAMTWEFWVNPAAFNGAIIDKWDAVPGRNQFSYGISVGSDGRISVALYPTSGSSFAQLISLSAIAAGQWTHVAATYDGANIRVYLNGVLDNSLAYTGGIFPGTDDLGIGGQVGGEMLGTANVPFSGLIDEVSGYNRALTAAEILAIYNAGGSGKCGSPPVIVSQPASSTNLVGLAVNFSVGAIGSPPLSYQWMLNGTNISATTNATATNATLTITNLQAGLSGNSYSVTVADSGGSTNSAGAVLTVLTPTSCNPVPSGLVGWWRAEGNALDNLGANNGGLLGNTTFVPGVVGQAFSFGGNGDGVVVTDSQSLRITYLTIEAWVKRGSASVISLNATEGTIFQYGTDGYGVGLLGDGTPHLGQVGSVNGAYGIRKITDTVFHHLAVTWDGTNAVFYLDGLADPPQPLSNLLEIPNGSIGIGSLDDGSISFLGAVDEISVYSRALSAAEVRAIYIAGGNGKCPIPPMITNQPVGLTVTAGNVASFSVGAFGSMPFTYQWQLNGTNVNGATNPVLQIPAVQASDAGNYTVIVTGSSATTSSNALLTVNPAVCLSPPPGLVSWWQAEGNALDAVGANSGTFVTPGATPYAAGKVNQAFNFSGSNYVQIPHSASLLQSNYSVVAWVNVSQMPALGNSVLIFGQPNGSYSLTLTGWDQPYFYFNTPHVTITSHNPSPTNTFVQVAATCDGNSMRLYVNGVLDNQIQFPIPPADGGTPLYIGGSPSGQFFTGLIDEVACFNRALSPAEVQALYNASRAGMCALPPVIAAQPAGQAVPPGGSATFGVTATGSQPLSYQWKSNGTSILTATNSTLTVTNVQVTQSGNLYSVLVSNGGGFTNSSNAVLTVITSCTSAPTGLAGWWQAEGNANDSAGTNNGTLHGAAGFTNGEAGQAFRFDGVTGYVSIPASPGLNVGTNAGFTLEGWIKPASLTVNAPLTEWNSGSPAGYGSHFWINQPTTASGNGPGSLFANLVDTGGTYHLIASPAGVLNTNAFQHVALTYNKTNNTATLYCNGTAVVSQVFSPFTPQTSYGLYFATRPGAGYFYPGLMDELSLYNRALTSNEIAAIYNAGSSAKCPLPPLIVSQPAGATNLVGTTANFTVTATGSQPLGYQWKLNGTNISTATNATATNATLTVTNVQLGMSGNGYSVMVSNPGGATNSTGAMLTVNPPPSCLPAPAGLVSWWQAEGNANDSAGTNNGTLLNGAAFAAGEAGQAFSLDGSTSHVRVKDAPSLHFTNGMTLEAWIYQTAVPGSAGAAILAKWDTVVGPNQRSYGLGTAPDGTGNIVIDTLGTGTTGYVVLNTIHTIPLNQWTHFAGTYDGTTLKCYINGVLDSSMTFSGSIYPGTADLGIGAVVGEAPIGSGLSLFPGRIDEASVYNRALTSNEIAAIYNSDSSGKCALPPLIVSQPAGATNLVGTTANFTVTATGSQPLGYQWKLNGTNISTATNATATNATLTVTNVQLGMAGNSYSVMVNNGAGSTNSSAAVLTVITSCTTPPSGLVSWWQAESNANDSAGTNNGTLLNGATFAAGKVGQTFNLNSAGAHVRIHDAPNLRFTNGMTLEAWIYPTSVGGGVVRAIIVKWDTVVGPNQRAYGLNLNTDGTVGLGIDMAGTGTTGVNSVYSTNVIPTGQWTHVAGTYDGTTLRMYVNGVLNNSLVFSGSIFPGTADLGIGAAVGEAPIGGGLTFFAGLIDEASVYNRALTSNEVAAIYNAGASGKCALPPLIASQPAGTTNIVGTTANFTVTATGGQPLGYQWKLNGTNISTATNATATNATLTVTNVQLGMSGNNYSVMVSNGAGSTNSAGAVLTVTPPPSCLPPPSNLVSWWQAEGNGNDSAGTNNGTLLNGAAFAAGEAGQAFNLNGSNQFVRIPNSASLNPSGSFSIEGWIFMKQSVGEQGIMVKWGDTGDYNNQRSYIFATEAGSTLNFAISDVANQGNAAFHTFLTPTNAVALNTWTHVAAVYDQSTGTRRIYVNGTNVASRTDSPITVLNGIADVGIGGKVGSSTFTQSFWPGMIDEVSLYNRALSGAEITAIYNAGSLGKCPLPPLIVSQPAGTTNVVGTTANFSVTATGSQPLSYQWKLNGTNISTATNATATNATLTVTNVQLGQSGNSYSVMVSNPAGSTNSAGAALTVTPPVVSCLPPPSGLVSWWAAEGNANDSAGTNNGTLLNGAAFAAGEAGQAFSFDGTSSHVRIHDAPNLRFTSAMTLEAWIYPTSVGGGFYRTIFGKWDTVVGPDQRSYGLSLNTDGTVGLGIDTLGTGTTGVATANSTNVMPANQWTHVAGTYDGGTLKVYVNGVLNNSTAVSGSIFPGTADLAIGAIVGEGPSGSALSLFAGLIDEASAYNRALSSNEIAAIYHAGASGKCALPPLIVSQPASTTNVLGTTANFTVTATGSQPLSYQWKLNGSNILAAGNATATNATLTVTNVQLGMSGNSYSVLVSNGAGSTNSTGAVLTVTPPTTCTPAPSGLIGWWPGEGTADDLVGGNAGVLLNGVTFTNGEVGQGFSFNGTNQSVQIPYSPGLIRSNYTVEAWIKPNSQVTDPLTGNQDLIFAQGFGSVQLVVRTGTTGVLVAFGFGYAPNVYSVVVSSNQIPIGQFSHVAGAWDGTTLRLYINGVLQGQLTPGTTPLNTGCDFSIGGFYMPSAGGCTYVGQFFDGVIDELSYYGRSLAPAEVQAVFNQGAAGKCHVAALPVITSQPAGQTVPVGAGASFSVSATGATPFMYQWKLNGTNIPTATNVTLTVTNVQTGQSGGLYSVLVSNPGGSTNSSNAVLNVVPATTTLQVVSVTASNGVAVVPIDLLARGNENAAGFSITFDPALLTFTGVTPGSGSTGALILSNTNQLPAGKLGLGVSLPANTTFAAGTRELVKLNFTIPSVASTMVSAVMFGDQPTARQVSDAQASAIAALYVDGTVTIPFLGYEGDVTPRPNGDKTNSITDWVEVGRFVAGLDFPTNSNEFQRADCAPRATLGDGLLTASDWVQAGRYALGIDPPTLAGGPSGPALPMVVASGTATPQTASARTITALNGAALAGQPCQVSIQLNSQGDEAALGFSVTYDSTLLTLTGVGQGAGAGGTLFNVNTNQPGVVGLALSFAPGSTFPAGIQELAKLDFVVSPSAASPALISFASQPVIQEVASGAPDSLPTSYVSGRIDITPLFIASPTLSVAMINGNVVLSWPATTTGFVLESTDDPLSGNWTGVDATPVANSTSITVTVPASASRQFYRLHHQ